MRGFLKAVSLSLFGLMAVWLSGCGSDGNDSTYVVRIDVTPSSATVAKGATLQLQAVATYSDDTTEDVTSQAIWTTSDPNVAAVGNAGASKGVVSGVLQSSQPVTINAVFDAVLGSATITVTQSAAVRIDVSPAAPTIAKGTTQQLQAVVVYSDNSAQDITAQATWTSGAPTVASVDDSSGNKGLVTGLTQRTAPVAISAALGDLTGTALVTVGAPLPVRVEITPATLSLPNGTTQPLTATAVYTDNSTQDVTDEATWQSAAEGVVSVGNSGDTKGQVTGNAVTASPVTITANFETFSDTAEVTVTAAVLDEIQVSPANAQVPAGLTRQFTATGIFSDNSTQDVTATAQWTSSAPAVATIGNDAANKGLLTGVEASDDAVTLSAAVDGVTGTTTATVTDGVVQSIEVQPAAASVPRFGFKARFSAIGTLSDGSTVDLTSQATWSSSAAGTVATIGNSGSERGVATSGNTAGTSEIRAAFGAVTSTAATLTVTNAALQSIELQADADAAPETELTLSLGRSLNLRAIGVFSTASGGLFGGSTSSRQDITQSVTWSSCVPGEDPCTEADNIATVSNAAATKGRVVTQSPGAAAIGASLTINNGTTSTTRTASLGLTVTNAALVSLAVSPSTQSLPRNYRTPFTAMGTFSDGSVVDVTDEVTWVSADSSVATISNLAGEQGVAKGGAVGTTEVFARQPYTSVEGGAQLTVTAATLTGIAVTPTNETIKQGQTLAYTATGQFSGDGTLDITEFNGVDWSVSDNGVANFMNLDAANEITGLAQGGPVAVTATQTPPNSASVSGSTNLTVAGYALRRVYIVPETDEGCELDVSDAEYEPMPRGYRRNFLACAEFFNDTVEDVTAKAAWTTQAAAVVTVNNTAGSKGVATAATAATFGEQGVIRAQYTEDDITSAGSYTIRIVGVDTLVVAGSPDPAAAPLAAGATITFSATASFEGNPDVDVSDLVTWTSSESSVASFGSTAGTRNVATVQPEPTSGTPPSSSQITASFGGTTSNALTITRAD